MSEFTEEATKGFKTNKKRDAFVNDSEKGGTSSDCGGTGGGAVAGRCQAQGCEMDLSKSKRYYWRHKVCEVHAKASAVIVAGLRQRFCQQCSRFHELSEFDNTKRSCRRRLAGHNERRRKSYANSRGEGSSVPRRSGDFIYDTNYHGQINGKNVENCYYKQLNLH